jgi:hypothetical protein
LWDVDGNGLKKIDDPTVARKLVEKVDAFNVDTAAKCLLASGLFAALPQSVSAPLVGSAVAFAGKKPSELDCVQF